MRRLSHPESFPNSSGAKFSFKKGPVAHRPRLIITSIIIFTPYLFDLYFSGPPVPLIHLVIIFIIIIISIPVLIISVYLLLLFRN